MRQSQLFLFSKLLNNSKHRETEILDVAPIDIFNALTSRFLHNFPAEILSEHLRAQALDIVFHWVNETGKPAHLTAGGIINVTVYFMIPSPFSYAILIK
jgi:hypothetical protein